MWIMSSDKEATAFSPPDPVVCEYCGQPRYHRGTRLQDRILWIPVPQPCSCPEAVAAKEKAQAEAKAKELAERKAAEEQRIRNRIKKLIGESGMRERFLHRTFETFKTPDNKTARALRVATTYAENFDSKLPGPDNIERLDRNGLFITGGIGTGKTHLAAAIANNLMSKGKPVICMTMIDLLARIKATYDSGQISEGEVLKLYETVPLLIIDDIGKEPATEWGVSKIYAIINARYEAYMPTIITTNYDDQTLVQRLTPPKGDNMTAEATVDRLREMCAGLIMDGPSWRSR